VHPSRKSLNEFPNFTTSDSGNGLMSLLVGAVIVKS
jgi:hypothetical protein